MSPQPVGKGEPWSLSLAWSRKGRGRSGPGRAPWLSRGQASLFHLPWGLCQAQAASAPRPQFPPALALWAVGEAGRGEGGPRNSGHLFGAFSSKCTQSTSPLRKMTTRVAWETCLSPPRCWPLPCLSPRRWAKPALLPAQGTSSGPRWVSVCSSLRESWGGVRVGEFPASSSPWGLQVFLGL